MSAKVAGGWQRSVLVCALLAAAVAIVYGQAAGFDFVNIDDPGYVQNNEHVRGGLTRGGIIWAFTATDQANWHPLTWISLMLDATVGGAGPRVFHLTNVALHLLSAWLLFFVLGRMTGAMCRSSAFSSRRSGVCRIRDALEEMRSGDPVPARAKTPSRKGRNGHGRARGAAGRPGRTWPGVRNREDLRPRRSHAPARTRVRVEAGPARQSLRSPPPPSL